MKIVLSEMQIQTLKQKVLLEAKGIKGCGVFVDRNLKEFCKASESIISDNLTKYKKEMENLLMKYFTTDDKVKTIEYEKLENDSPRVLEGFQQIEEVTRLISNNCPESENVAKKLKLEWLKKYNIYFKDNDGNYHLLNRLDTNYSAMAVLVTTYYENIIGQVRQWVHSKKLPAQDFAQNWVDHFFNNKIELIDPRQNWEKDILNSSKELEELPNPVSVFNKIFGSGDFVADESEYQKNFMRALEEVRESGFRTERLFEEYLKEYKIEYIPYNYDYSFVDMILGVDFLIKSNRNGEDYWIPVQVKTSKQERFNLIDKLKCTRVIKPTLEMVGDKEDFKIGDVKGFYEYFCQDNKFCKVDGKKRPPSWVDYLSSDAFNK
jgi:hypothetical protein